MRQVLKLLVILALVAVPWTTGAQDIRINPVPPGLKPQWTKIPGASQVAWAPNLPTDVFRYRGKYYFFWENYFYQGPAPQGPWKLMGKVPEVFYDIDPAYFKTVKKAAGTPAAPAASAEPAPPPPKAKIIDIPPTAPAAQPPPAPASPSPAGPGKTPAPPAKVM